MTEKDFNSGADSEEVTVETTSVFRADFLNELGGRASGTRFIFPNAPKRSIDWPDGVEHGREAAGPSAARGGTCTAADYT